MRIVSMRPAIDELASAESDRRTSIEERARGLISKAGLAGNFSPITSMIEEEIELVLEHLTRIHEVHEDQHKSLLEAECATGSELLGLEQRTPPYSPERYPEREKLLKRLQDLGAERRKLMVTQEERIQRLERDLLVLVHRHDHLSPQP